MPGKAEGPKDSLYDFLMHSILPESAINRIDAPALNRGVGEAQLRGFAAGALDSATSPMTMASVIPTIGGIARLTKAAKGAKAAKDALRTIPDVLRNPR